MLSEKAKTWLAQSMAKPCKVCGVALQHCDGEHDEQSGPADQLEPWDEPTLSLAQRNPGLR